MPTYGHRSNEEAADRLGYILPDNDVAKPLLGAFTRAIEIAHDVAPKMWAVTLSDRVVRLNFGPVEVFVIFRDRAWFALRGGGRRRVGGLTREQAPHKHLDGTDWLIGAHVPIGEEFESSEAAFRTALENVCARYKQASYLNGGAKRAHARGLLEHLESRLDLYLPRPAWDVAADAVDAAVDEGPSQSETNSEVNDAPVEQEEVDAFEDVLGVEGGRILRTHVRIERSARAVREAKEHWLRQDPLLACEACGFSAATTYGQPYCEAHHRVPLATLTEAVETTLADLARVCANCHRALHRHPEWTVETLASALRARGVRNDGGNP